MELKKLIATISILAMLSVPSLFTIGCKPKSQSLPQENGTIEIMFSKTDDCLGRLEQILNGSISIEAALYDLDIADLITILKAKNADVLIDEDNYFGYGTKMTGEGLMHDKFWLAYYPDGKSYVVTGSINPTMNDFFKNDNNMVIISSKYLEQNYAAEFKELKNNERHQPTRYQQIIFNNHLLENYFCPDDQCEGKVLVALKKTRSSIDFMTFSFTSDPIGDYLIAQKNNLDIRGIFDESQYKSQKQYSEYGKMLSQNMDVKLDGNPYKLHHKVFIIDRETVILGSYNPTGAGTNKNDENILIIHDPDIAALFLHEFERVWQLAKVD